MLQYSDLNKYSSSSFGFVRERRLLGFKVDKPTKSETVAESDLKNAMKVGEGDPSEALEGHTKQLLNKLEAMPRGYIDTMPVQAARRLARFITSPLTFSAKAVRDVVMATPIIGGILAIAAKPFPRHSLPAVTYEARFNRAIEEEALRRIRQGGRDLDKTRRVLLWRRERAENRILLLQYKKQVLEDLSALNQVEREETARAESESAALEAYFGARHEWIRPEELKQRDQFTKAAADLRVQIDAELAQEKQLPQNFSSARQWYGLAQKALSDAKVSPKEITAATRDFLRGNRQTMVALLKEKARPIEIRQTLVSAAERMQITDLQLVLGLQSEVDDALPIEKRCQRLFKNPPVQPILLQISGKRFAAFYVGMGKSGRSMIFQKQGESDEAALVAISENAQCSTVDPDGTIVTRTFEHGNKDTFLRNPSSEALYSQAA